MEVDTALEILEYPSDMTLSKSFTNQNIFISSDEAESVHLSSEFLYEQINKTKLEILKYCSMKYQAEIDRVRYPGFLASLQNLLQGTGFLEPSALFMGQYSYEAVVYYKFTYNVPLAFMWVFLITIVMCIVMMLQYSSFGMQEAFLTHHRFQRFTNEIFCSWDYCIKSQKAAAICHDSFVYELKSNLGEVRRRREVGERSTATWIKLYFIRSLVNILVLILIIGCYILLYMVQSYQIKELKVKHLTSAGLRTLAIQYLPSFTLVAFGSISPFIFDFLVSFENYHEQKKINVSLLRNVFLSLSSIIVMVIAFGQQITCKPKGICGDGKSPDCNTPRCWETYVGQQLYKLTLSQLFATIAVFLCWDIPRDIIVRKYNNRLTRLLGRASFFLPTEVLLPVYSQAILWLGDLYSPFLPAIRIIMLILLFYMKKAKVLKYSQPAQIPYKASRFNSAFVSILMISFLVVMTFHWYTIVNVRPSLGCGPFRYYDSMIDALEGTVKSLPINFFAVWKFLFSGWFFVPACIFMCSIIVYYWNHIAFLTRLEKTLKAEIVLLGDDNKFLLESIVDIDKRSE